MTVQELLQLLEMYPGDVRVAVNGYKESFDGVSFERIAVVEIQLNRGTRDWQGRRLEPAKQTTSIPDGEDLMSAPAIFYAFY